MLQLSAGGVVQRSVRLGLCSAAALAATVSVALGAGSAGRSTPTSLQIVFTGSGGGITHRYGPANLYQERVSWKLVFVVTNLAFHEANQVVLDRRLSYINGTATSPQPNHVCHGTLSLDPIHTVVLRLAGSPLTFTAFPPGAGSGVLVSNTCTFLPPEQRANYRTEGCPDQAAKPFFKTTVTIALNGRTQRHHFIENCNDARIGQMYHWSGDVVVT